MWPAVVAALLLSVFPALAEAQAGLGSFELVGQRKNHPVAQKGFTHPNGAPVICFFLPGNSCNGDDCETDRERAQLKQRTDDNRAGESYRYSVSFYLPSDFVDVRPTNLMLWEVKPLGTGKPSAVVEIIDGYLQFSLSNPAVTQRDKMNPEKPLIIKRIGPIPRGRWTDIILDARWSRGADGVISVYHNGDRLVDYSGPNIDSNSSQQVVMYGVYRSFISRYLSAKGADAMPLQQACFANVTRQKVKL